MVGLMKLKFLGTGGVLGSPVWNCNCKTCTSTDSKNKRYRASLLVQIDDKNIIIDFGQDFANQLRDAKIKKIDYAFLTHAHRDHCTGAEQLSVAENCIMEAPNEVLEDFFQREGSSRNWLATRNKTLIIREFQPKKIGGFEIQTIKLKHEKDYTDASIPCYGYLFTGKNFSFAYCSDFNAVLEPEKLKNLDLIISDGSGMRNKGQGHVGVDGSIEIYHQFKPKEMILTHIPHTIEHKELEAYLKPFGNIHVAYDGMELIEGKTNRLY